MKKIFVLLMFLGVSVAISAQKMEGVWELLRDESRVNFVLDFSKAHIHGMTEAEFSKYEDDWHKDMPRIVGDFLETLNGRMAEYVRFGKYPAAKLTLKVQDVDVAVDGSFDSDVLLLDGKESVLAKIEGLRAKGGLFGTKLYLIKNGAENSGRELGKILYKTLRKR